MKIAIIPIDNRPVCYSLLSETAKTDNDLQLLLPDKKMLGGLTSNADISGILNWLEKIDELDAIVVSLDTISYGGLVSSRRCTESFEEVQKRIERLNKICLSKNTKIYAFSSIMRISNNNVNEEEKEYWDKYGTQIFEYSYNFHKDYIDSTEVPKEIILDYLNTRRRNFNINKLYLDWVESGLLNLLVFSKDDCAEYGFNVLESQVLERTINDKKLSAIVKTGADEIPLLLFARAVRDYNNEAPKIYPKFLAPEFKQLVSNYEDISIEHSVKSQILLSGGLVAESEEDSDIVLLVNNFEEFQGEIVMGVKTLPFSGQFSFPEKPYMIADVRFANGADNNFIEKLFKKSINFENFYGYSAWNTSANTLGSLICVALVRFFAKNYNEDAFKKLQMTRFLDDWAYQANVRQALKGKPVTVNGERKRPDVRKLKKLMIPFEKKMQKLIILNTPIRDIKYYFPWKRFFEVGIVIK